MEQVGELTPLLPHPVEVLVALVPIGICVALVIATVITLVRTSRAGSVGRGREEAVVQAIRLAGVALGVGLGVYAADASSPFGINLDLGANLILGPIVFGLVVLVSVTVAEIAVRPRLDNSPRTAVLRPRRMRDHLPAVLFPAVGVLTLAAVALCAWSWSVASADDMGREGRSLHAVCSPTTSAGRGPFPGSFYAQPYLIGLAAALLIAVAAAYVVNRRVLGGTPEQAEHHRQVGLRTIVGAYGTTLALPLVGIAFFAGTTTLGHTCPQTGWLPMGWFAVAVCCAALVVAMASLVAVLAPEALVRSSRTEHEAGHV